MPTRRKRAVLARISLALSFTLGCAIVTGCEGRAGAAMPAVGGPAPAYTAMDLEGAPTALAALKGKVVVLNVWATWCLPCKEEIPQLDALYRKYAAQGVEFIGVSVDAAGMGAEVRDFAREHGMSYPVWLDPDNEFAVKFLSRGVPETYVVDRTGVIRSRLMGALRPDDQTLDAAIRSALQQ